jgi:hypothetical protein
MTGAETKTGHWGRCITHERGTFILLGKVWTLRQSLKSEFGYRWISDDSGRCDGG